MMHAKHADRVGLNDLSELVIGCGFAVLNAHVYGFLKRLLRSCWQMRCASDLNAAGRQFLPRLDFGKPRPAIERVFGGLSNSPRPSACFA
jgi:hypothetical protein